MREVQMLPTELYLSSWFILFKIGAGKWRYSRTLPGHQEWNGAD